MKPTITFTTAIILCFTILSCKDAKEETIVPKTKTYDKLQKANWFLGEWSNYMPEAEMTERWKKVNDSVYNGESYIVINEKDTVFAEKMSLEEVNGNLSYIVTVANQNNTEPVRFDMTSANDTLIVFENEHHDFPTKITYTKVGDDTLVAEIWGTKDGKPSSEKFTMKKHPVVIQ